MPYFPLFLDIRDRDVLVVGGGEAAARKVRVLVDAGARVRLVAQMPHGDVDALAIAERITLHRRSFRKSDVLGCALVVSAAGCAVVDRVVSEAARAAGIPVNAVDRPELCTFLWPAIVDRHPVMVAIGSAGASPVLARSIRARIEALLPANLGRLARFAADFRAAVKATRLNGTRRRRFWERFFDGPVAAAVLTGDEQAAREQMLVLINRRDEDEQTAGSVALVGAGPGDPELLTLRAMRLLQEADVIVHDRLVDPRVLEYARRDAERIDVGKAPGGRGWTQVEINHRLAELARAGRRVVRLKGGDPFIFGRGGEERAYLRACGVRVEVVAGITAAVGCAAAAGIPLTRRGTVQAVTLITARGREGSEPDLDWRALAGDGQTVAIYMGATMAGQIAGRLIAHGRDPATPSAVIADGTRPQQRLRVGHLRDLEAMAEAVAPGPVLMVIGEGVREADLWTEWAAPLAAAN